MAETTSETNWGNWGSLIALLAGVLGGLKGGQSLFGEPSREVSTVGPLTPEGQMIMDEYRKMLAATPMTEGVKMGNLKATYTSPARIGALRRMAEFEAARRGTQTIRPAETGLLGRLAPLLLALSNRNKNRGESSWVDDLAGLFRSRDDNYDAGTAGYDPNYDPGTDWMADIWRYGSEGE